MKKTFFVLLMAVKAGCGLFEPDLTYPESILAGEMEGEGIVYSGIIRDTFFFDYPSSGDSRKYDINQDGKEDFQLNFSGSASPGHTFKYNSIIPLNQAAVAVTPNFPDLADTLSLNQQIDKELFWVQDTCILFKSYYVLYGSNSSSGYWANARDVFAGLRIREGDEFLYGWISLEMTYGWNLTMVDYACTRGY